MVKEGARILVVDDEPQIRRSLQVNLESRGYPVVVVDDGEQALQSLSHLPPDVVIVGFL